MTEVRRTHNTRSFQCISLLYLCVTFVWQFEICQGNESECGQVYVERPLVKGGNRIYRGEWPFIVALYQVHQTRYEYLCGGTVISSKHILTAAHCIQGKYSPWKLSNDDILVRIGAYNLTATDEHGAIQRNVSEIYVHSEWEIYDDKYDADIAILVLQKTITFMNFIQPVCLSPNDAIVDGANIDLTGYIVGWGLSENETHEEIPRQTKIKALNDSYCYLEDNVVAAISSLRTFCSGEGDGVPNRGDSGGGFFVLQGSAWVQHGIISTIRTNGTGHVARNSFSVYTKVQMFKDWIDEVSAKENRINLDCSFEYTNQSEYGCWLYNSNISEKYVEVASFAGYHHHGHTHDDVEALYFINGTLIYLPYKIGKIFKNLKKLEISSVLGTKHLSRSNLKNLEKLTFLSIQKNDIEYFKRDCLWDLPNLEHFVINDNRQLETLPEKFFERNVNLMDVDLSYNSLQSLPINLFSNNKKLVAVDFSYNELRRLTFTLFQNNSFLEKIDLSQNSLRIIDESIFVNNINLKQVDLTGNLLHFLPANIFQKNTFLERVYLSENALKMIGLSLDILDIKDEDTFVSNIHLREVDLSYNQLETLSENSFQNNSLLEKIDLSANTLKRIDEITFVGNINVKEVYLQRNELESLPAFLFQSNPLLEIIDLSENPVKIIDENTFVSNINLKKVYLSKNELEILPASLFQRNPLLEKIDLFDNSFKVIDEITFVGNINLKELDLSLNKLELLSANLFQSNLLLEKIDLSENFLKTLDEITFINNINLKEVDLSSNKLETLPATLIQRNTFLEKVDLRSNSLNIIDESTFVSNINLNKVYVSSNKLEILPPSLFQNNPLLKIIDLRDNSIKMIDENTFFRNINLKVVYISSNKLEMLPTSLFHNNPLLEIINLSDNPLKTMFTNFSGLKNIRTILVLQTLCASASFNGKPKDFKKIDRFVNFINLAEFEMVVRANCSSA